MLLSRVAVPLTYPLAMPKASYVAICVSTLNVILPSIFAKLIGV